MSWLGLRKKRSVHFAEYDEVKTISIASTTSSPDLPSTPLPRPLKVVPHSGANHYGLSVPSTPPQRSSSPHHFRSSTPRPAAVTAAATVAPPVTLASSLPSKSSHASYEHVRQGSHSHHHPSHSATPSSRQLVPDKPHYAQPVAVVPQKLQKAKHEEHHHSHPLHHSPHHSAGTVHRPPAKPNCTNRYLAAPTPVPQRQRTTSAGAITLSLPTLQYYTPPKQELNHVHVRSSPQTKHAEPRPKETKYPEHHIKHRHSTFFQSTLLSPVYLPSPRKERPQSGHFIHQPTQTTPAAPRQPSASFVFVNETVNTNLSLTTPHGIRYQQQIYPSGEHLYHALKFFHRPTVMQEFLRQDIRPDEWAQRYRDYERMDWSRVRIQVMQQVVELRFSQHKVLRAELVATGTAKLCYRPNKQTSEGKSDTFWGIGDYFDGRNEYGKILMDLRARFAA